ncbi:MAG: hypothetical protein QOH68_3330 [Nocardioidaceae bacterium]|nr:hypothetical protein [Nocardioidaceae bacterium]
MRRARIIAGGLVLILVAPPALADGPSAPELPVLHVAAGNGGGTVTAGTPAHVAPSLRTIDGHIDDWQGTGTGFGGTVVRSAGELVYTDHLFDAYGADNGKDAERLGRLAPLNDAVPETYRLEPVFTSDIAGELGAPEVEALAASEEYGDAGRQDAADLLEVRLAADSESLYVLARTTTMTAADQTAILVLLDTVADSPAHDVPFGAGIHTEDADVAVLLANGAGTAVDLTSGVETPVPVAVDPTGDTNAIEAAVPASLLGGAPTISVAAAAGRFSPATAGFTDLPDLPANLANIAFRTAEPITVWFESQQALALLAGTIDEFAIDVDLSALRTGVNEVWSPQPGYHDRIFLSSPAISSEGGTEGIHQHYGIYLPSTYTAGTPVPLTFWLHWRGGKAHSAATVSPRILRDQGEAFGGAVISPRGRGSSSWYLGKGLIDVNEVWADAFATFSLDQNRVYVSGHSMGGWGSYLLSILYPDRFAGAFPVAGPVTQGAWTGVDFDGCDDYVYDEYSPCYIKTNDSDPRLQHTRRLLENLRNVPIAVYQGAIDELVPVSGVTRQVQRLQELGYRYRYYVFPTYEHYSHPVVDEWIDGSAYVHGFTRNPNPARVSYVRDMPFEQTVETGPSQTNKVSGISFDFDHAYWMSELTPNDLAKGVATFDGRSLALPDEPALRLPEAGGPSSPGQVGPFAMVGQQWLADPLAKAALANAFDVHLAGARAVRLDLARMSINSGKPVTATVTSDGPLELRLAGGWSAAPKVTRNGLPIPATLSNGILVVQLPAGASTLAIAL